jgi:hypothetical protein
VVQHLGHGGELAAGKIWTASPTDTRPAATRPQNTRRPFEVSAEPENFSTHCTGNASGAALSDGVPGSASRICSSVGPV